MAKGTPENPDIRFVDLYVLLETGSILRLKGMTRKDILHLQGRQGRSLHPMLYALVHHESVIPHDIHSPLLTASVICVARGASIAARPMASLSWSSVKLTRCSFAPVKLAFTKHAPINEASVTSAPTKQAPVRSALLNKALCSAASWKVAHLKLCMLKTSSL